MSHHAFTQGVEPGGLTTNYEIRLLICWLLHQLDKPISMEQLNCGLLPQGLVNYFELAEAVSLLLQSGHLLEEQGSRDVVRRLLLTALGVETAQTFEKKIPLNVREKALISTRESLLLEQLQRENRVEIEQTSDGYRLILAIADVQNDLLEMSMYVPTLPLAEKMKRRFLTDPTVIYRAALQALGDEEIGGSSLRD